MSNSTTTTNPPRTREETIAEFYRLRAEVAEATKDLTEEEYEALVEDLTRQVNEGLRQHVRQSRGDSLSR